jgi:hypothetical protein
MGMQAQSSSLCPVVQEIVYNQRLNPAVTFTVKACLSRILTKPESGINQTLIKLPMYMM